MKRGYLIIAVFLTAIFSVVGTAARVVFAHPSTASMTCQGGLVYEAHDYPNDAGNTVTAYIDKKLVAGFPKSFSGHISGHVANPDKTKPHTWTVVWDRVNGTEGDRSQAGEVDSCVIPPTTPSTTTTVPASSTTSTSSPSTVQPTTTTVTPTTTTIVLTDIDTPVVPTTTDTPTTTTDISQPPAPTGGLPATGIDISTFGWGIILIVAGFLLLAWNKRALRRIREDAMKDPIE